MFRSDNQLCKFKPKPGEQVLVSGKLTLYAPRGDYQIIVETMQRGGKGDLQAQFEALKLKLKQEGLFDEQIKKPIPIYPERIGLITSASGAVLRDLLQVFKRRCPSIPITLYPTSVQGEKAKTAIIAALNRALQDNSPCDVLIIARGGGSLEDLWCFNEESVVRAIAQSRIPTVSAIGHQTDVTLTDFVADLTAPTPSAAAELVGPDEASLSKRFRELVARIERSMTLNLQAQLTHIGHLSKRLISPSSLIKEQSQRADYLQQRMLNAIASRVSANASQLNHHHQKLILLQPGRLIQDHLAQVKRLTLTLNKSHTQQLGMKRSQLAAAAGRLQSASPLATLERGFSISSTVNGEILTDHKSVSIGDQIITRLRRGSLISRVESLPVGETFAAFNDNPNA